MSPTQADYAAKNVLSSVFTIEISVEHYWTMSVHEDPLEGE